MTGGHAPWAQALIEQGLPPEGLRDILAAIPALSAEDPVVLAGSIAGGIANRISDVDIYAVIAGDGVADDASHTQMVSGLGGRPVDIRLVPKAVVNALLERLATFVRGGHADVRLAESFTGDDRLLLHRLNTGLPVQGNAALTSIRERIGNGLVRQKHLCALTMVKRRQVTAQALFEDGDWRNLLFITRDIVDSSADLLLAAARDSSLALKWRLRRLEAAFAPAGSGLAKAEDDAPAERFLAAPAASYLRFSTFPVEPGLQSAFHYASAAVGWSRRAVLYAGCRLADSAALLRPVRFRARFLPPALRLDAHLAFAEGRFGLRRLGGPDPAWEISGEAASILSKFDGSADSDNSSAHVTSDELPERLTLALRQFDLLVTRSSMERV